MSYTIIIPARLASTRLPNKVLSLIDGKPMIQHVHELALRSGAERVCIATDSTDVEAVAREFGATVCLTASHHKTGTERVAEAARLLDLDPMDIVLGLQADEPQLPISIIESVAAELLGDESIPVATPCTAIESMAELMDPSVVKVVMNSVRDALYFSRAPIPWDRASFSLASSTQDLPGEYYRHVGLYAFRMSCLQQVVQWPQSPLERLESLEQLRLLSHGTTLRMVVCAESAGIGVDTQADLERIRSVMSDRALHDS